MTERDISRIDARLDKDGTYAICGAIVCVVLMIVAVLVGADAVAMFFLWGMVGCIVLSMVFTAGQLVLEIMRKRLES